MRKISALSCFLFALINSYAQQTEINAGMNAGFFKFSGTDAEKSSFIIRSGGDNVPGYTNDVYGRTSRLGGGMEISITRVNRSGFIYGVSAGVEILKSRVDIHAIHSDLGTNPAVGHVILTSNFIDLRPFAGYRIQLNKKTSIDLAVGLDFGIGLGPQHEKGEAIYPNDGGAFTDTDRDNAGLDIRYGLQARFHCKRLSFIAGYSIGIRNYYRGYIGADSEAYSRLFRTGMNYRINK